MIFTHPRSALRRPVVAATLLALAAVGFSSGAPDAGAAAVPKTRPPLLQRGSKNVTADSLPTAQVDGIVLKQVIVGNTVFAAGRFSSARPAGVAAGGAGTVARSGLMSYDIRNGKMTTFAPKFTGGVEGAPTEVESLALSPDKKILYVGGNFTAVGGKGRQFFAAFTVSTGKLRPIHLALKSQVRSIATLGKHVYIGGYFKSVNGHSRLHAAAVSPSTGALLSWNPSADSSVEALLVNPAKNRVILGGRFSTLRGHKARGMGAVTTVAGAVRTWHANSTIQNYGDNSAILDLTADKDTVYGAAYGYQSGNYEGVFAVSPTAGSIKWLQDCHGDQYGVVPIGNLVYSVGHAHFCTNIGGFGEIAPQRAMVVSKTARGTVAPNSQTDSPNYHNWAGYQAPAIVNWFPVLDTGNFSGSHQGAWTVRGTSKYVVMGGEFHHVNGKPQQGLARFTTPGNKAPKKIGPSGSSNGMTPRQVSSDSTGRTLSWLGNYDRDDKNLTYKVLREGKVIATFTRAATFYHRPQLTYKDTTAKAGVGYHYQIYVRDKDGNSVRSVVLYSAR